ncbi:zinc finger protein [Trypanosoma rangeli]|uniref:Zinc finger protein n=1 Tax=Trypanosoma rangeli TaxID=5698 RepID=A0A422NWB5_TRYRA|nr:zinc finger protein [Trypanosoma rangeli]RNF09729.1 zinc finger protein [Trypanosoma rangeli]|eukprot:RNF09729.1 zinc finger protein [Trypanosoma rangeli]
MTFEFQLHQPPCDLAFLAVVNGPVLYNADNVTSGAVKRETIRQIGWHVLRLPEEWFFSEKSREMTEKVCHVMQCTIQYLVYCQRQFEAEVADAQRRAEELREERDELFEELVVLRETVAQMRQRRVSNSRDGMNAGIAVSHHLSCVEKSGRFFTCSLCGNGYPSSSSLESHLNKRHHRGAQYAAMTAATTAAQNKVVADTPWPSDALTKELASLRAEVMDLREAMAVTQEKRRLDANFSLFSPISVVTLPAHQLPGTPFEVAHPSQKQRGEKLIDALQDELRVMRSRVQHMEGMMCQQAGRIEGGCGRRTRELDELTSREARLTKADSSPPEVKHQQLASCASGSSAHSLNGYPSRAPATPDMMHTEDFTEKQVKFFPRQKEARESNHAADVPARRSSTFFTGTLSLSSQLLFKPSSTLPMAEVVQASSASELEPQRSASPQGQNNQSALEMQTSVPTEAEATATSAAVENDGPSEPKSFPHSSGLNFSILNSLNVDTFSCKGLCASRKLSTNQTYPTSYVGEEEANNATNDELKASGRDEADGVMQHSKPRASLSSLSRESSETFVSNPKMFINSQEISKGSPVDSYVIFSQPSAQRESPETERTVSMITSSLHDAHNGKGVKSRVEAPISERQREKELSVEGKGPGVGRRKMPLKGATSEKSKKWKFSFISKIFRKQKK